MVTDRIFIFHMCTPSGKTLSLVIVICHGQGQIEFSYFICALLLVRPFLWSMSSVSQGQISRSHFQEMVMFHQHILLTKVKAFRISPDSRIFDLLEVFFVIFPIKIAEYDGLQDFLNILLSSMC